MTRTAYRPTGPQLECKLTALRIRRSSRKGLPFFGSSISMLQQALYAKFHAGNFREAVHDLSTVKFRSQAMEQAMSPETQLASVVTMGIVMFVAIRTYKALFLGPRTADPWSPQITESLESPEAMALCLHCLAEQPPGNWFCPECGHATGPYITTMPYLYLFAEADALRNGTSDPRRFNGWQVVAFVLLSIPAFFLAFAILAILLLPAYWFLLWKNIERSRTLDPQTPVV